MPGERVGFDEFYATYHARLVRFASAAFGAADADDIAQEAMARAYAAYDRFDPGRDAWPWLTVIARRAAADARAANARAVPGDVSGQLSAATDVAEQAEQRDLIRAALLAQAAGVLPAAVLITGAVVAGFATTATAAAGPAAFGVTHAGPAARTAAPTRSVRPVVAAWHGTATTRRAAPAPQPASRAVVTRSSSGLPMSPTSPWHDHTVVTVAGQTVLVDKDGAHGGQLAPCAALAIGCR